MSRVHDGDPNARIIKAVKEALHNPIDADVIYIHEHRAIPAFAAIVRIPSLPNVAMHRGLDGYDYIHDSIYPHGE